MSRVIKFRVWDSHDRRMIQDIHITRTNASVNDLFRTERYLYQQFTGLLDKHGVEIYEGDILTNERHSALWEARWDSKMVAFYANESRWTEHPMYVAAWTLTNKQVIGNIYQHPDLIGGDKEATRWTCL